jgi:hypothetical protein
MMYNDHWASHDAAMALYRRLVPKFGPRLMVVGEDDHIHIEVGPPYGAGYDGRDGEILPHA